MVWTTVLCACLLLFAGCAEMATSSPADADGTIAINCGADEAVTDADGVRWAAQKGFHDGGCAERDNVPGDDGALTGICRTERYGMTGFWLPMRNGKYAVELTFCETYPGTKAAGQRVFDVDVEGTTFKRVDAFGEGGGLGKPIVKRAEVYVLDGKLDIDFISTGDTPIINGVRITPLADPGPAKAPKGFDEPRDVPHGKTTHVTYPSKALGWDRKANIYTPPGYDPKKKYPSLYLLHGGGGDEHGWKDAGALGTIMDNLLADGRITPMIVVMPNGYVTPPGETKSRPLRGREGLETFEKDIVEDLRSYVEANYSVYTDAEHRALAGLSMGGMQTLWIGPRNLDRFAYLGVFSGGIFGSDTTRGFPTGDEVNAKLKLFWYSCGLEDPYYPAIARTRQFLTDQGVRYRWLSQDGGHHWPVWRETIYLMSQQLFQ